MLTEKLIARVKAGDERAGDALYREVLPLVQSIATRLHCRSKETRDEMVGAGLLGIAKAVQGYEAGRGTRFVTYAYHHASGEMRKYLRDHSRLIRIPWRVQQESENPDVFIYQPLEEWIPYSSAWEDDVVTTLEAQRVIEALPPMRGSKPGPRRKKAALKRHFGWEQ